MFALHRPPLPCSRAGLFIACLVPDVQDKKDVLYASPAPLDHINRLSPFSELQTARNDFRALLRAQESLAKGVG